MIQARDGRRMSKSLGTGIDPLEEIDVHGADALRFGLLAMSSTQDVRYSDAKVQQGRDLANKMWNASRLILLNATRPSAAPPQPTRRPRTAGSSRGCSGRSPRSARSLERYDFAHAALELYRVLLVRALRLVPGDRQAAALRGRARRSRRRCSDVLEQMLALAHPMMPFVTEEIWAHHPAREGQLVVRPFPQADEALIDPEAEREVGEAIELTRAAARLARPRRGPGRERAAGARRGRAAARVRRPPGPLRVRRRRRRAASPRSGRSQVLASGEIDAAAVGERIEERRDGARGRGRAGERKLANEGFVAKAPPEVVEEERQKLERYRAELEELGQIGRRTAFDAEAYLDALEPLGWRLGPRPHPAPHLGARDAAAPVLLDTRRRDQRQVVGRPDDRGAAGGATA